MKWSVLCILLCGLMFSALTARAQSPLGTGFTYQGQLKQSGTPMNGTVNLRFSLWDAPGSGSPPAGGNQVGISQQFTSVPVTNGLFTVTLNGANQFGASPFAGQARFLQIDVCGDANCLALTTLAPRQPLNVVPFASFAAAPWARPAGGSSINYSAGNVGVGLSNPSAALHVSGNLGIGVANIPAGLTSELGGTNTPILNLDVNFRHPNRNSSLVGGAIRIDARSDTADPLFQFNARPPGSSAESMVASLTQDGRMNLNGGLNINVLAGIRPNLQITGVDFDSIKFALSGHSRVGFIHYVGVFDRIALGNDLSLGFAELQDDGSWSALSDRRAKTDIAPAEDLLDKALALRPVEFYMKNQDRSRNPDKCVGLIAQDVQPLFPSLVHTGADDTLTLNYDRFGVIAIGAIQQQQQVIADCCQKMSELQAAALEQQRRLDSQESQIRELTSELRRLAAAIASPAPTR